MQFKYRQKNPFTFYQKQKGRTDFGGWVQSRINTNHL